MPLTPTVDSDVDFSLKDHPTEYDLRTSKFVDGSDDTDLGIGRLYTILHETANMTLSVEWYPEEEDAVTVVFSDNGRGRRTMRWTATHPTEAHKAALEDLLGEKAKRDGEYDEETIDRRVKDELDTMYRGFWDPEARSHMG